MKPLFSPLSREEAEAMRRQMNRELAAKFLGEQILQELGAISADVLARTVDSWQSELLCEIKAILDHPDAEDADCFHAIEAIIGAYERRGLSIRRHNTL